MTHPGAASRRVLPENKCVQAEREHGCQKKKIKKNPEPPTLSPGAVRLELGSIVACPQPSHDGAELAEYQVRRDRGGEKKRTRGLQRTGLSRRTYIWRVY